MNKYRNTEPAKGKLVRHMEKRAPIQNYLIKGHVKTISKYSKTRAGITKYHDKEYVDNNPMYRTIAAKSEKGCN